MFNENGKYVVVFDEDGEPIRWGPISSGIIKRFMEKFVSIVCDTKEIAKNFCGKASRC
ncbi:MAG: hypothetical protein ACD_7C00018G0001 [uncultured bacterium]|nr:MAG: hypothetical protein ACD_7C00018G0001 [uncultured bacterium]